MGTHNPEPVFSIDGTEILIATGSYGSGTPGKSQTINVFDNTHTKGHYREVYRISDPSPYVTMADITENARDLHELDRYLIMRGAVREGGRST